MFKFNQLLPLVMVFLLFAQMGKSNFSHARRVKEVTLAATDKDFAVEGNSNFSSPMEILDSVPSATQVKKSSKIRGRKMSANALLNTNKETTSGEEQGSRNNKKVSNIRDHKENWKENIMAFSADYRSPKSHPPKNN